MRTAKLNKNAKAEEIKVFVSVHDCGFSSIIFSNSLVCVDAISRK